MTGKRKQLPKPNGIAAFNVLSVMDMGPHLHPTAFLRLSDSVPSWPTGP